jgi:hypothetical protein
MARAMKKFSAGGAQGKYDRRMADIKKDFAKDSAGKSGRALEVLEAKRAQRIADAEDDRAKRMGTDRTATRAAERLAESNLTKTRKYGAPKAVSKLEPIASEKITETLSVPKMDASIGAKPAAKKSVARTPVKSKPSAADTARGKFFQDSLAKADFKKTAKMAEAPIAPSKFDSKAFADLKAKMPKPTVTTTGGTALRGKPGGTPLIRFGRDVANDPARKAKLAEMKRAAEAPGASAWAKDRYKYAVSSGMYAKGGAVKKKETTMKYRSGGSTPPKPTAADRAADAKFRKSIKNLKPTPEQAAAIGRANRSSGYAKGGKVKKMAVGGMAPNTAGGTVTRATPGNTLTGVPSPSAPAANTAGGTVTRATPGNTLTGVPSPSAPAANTAARATTTSAAPQTASPTTTAPAPYKPVTPLQNVQNFIDRKYSSATPNRDASATANPTTQASTPAKFDRNQSLRDFNSVARTFLNQGVSNKELIRAQGELRKLQMDNSSTPAQHQAAMQSIIARMNSLVPSKGAGAGAIKGPGGGLAKGGSTKAATKSGRALVKKSADTGGRAMKKYAKGGLVGGHKAANGIAKKGLTKGKQVKMNKGGACYAKGGSVRSIDGIATKGKTRCKGARK